MFVCRIVGVVGFLAFLVAFAGCAAIRMDEHRPPNIDGATWIQIDTPHFQVQTDLPEDQALELVEGFHQRAHALSWALLEQQVLPEFHSRIIVFRRDKDFDYFAPGAADAFALPGLAYEGGDVATIVQSGKASQTSFATFQHELTHRILFEAFGHTPPWLSEGMAAYYAAMSADAGVLRLGEQPSQWIFSQGGRWKGQNRASHWQVEVPVAQLIPPARLVAADSERFYPDLAGRRQQQDARRTATLHYASSWVLVHLLLNGPEAYRERFARILADVAAGATVRDAVRSHLAEVPSKDFERDFFAHVQAQQRSVWQTTMPGESPPLTARVKSLRPAEVALLWAKLARAQGKTERAQIWVAEAALADPEDPEVLLVTALIDLERRDLSQARDKLERAHARWPEDPEPLVLLTYLFLWEPAIEPSAERRRGQLERWTEKLRPLAKEAHQLQAVAVGLAATGRLDSAERKAKQAIHANPNCWSCFDVLAAIRFDKGDREGAAQLQEIAIARAWESAGQRELHRLQSRLREYRMGWALGEETERAADDDPTTVRASAQ